MLHVVWEFHIKSERQKDFERHYGSHGTWAMLFRKSPFYDRTILTRDAIMPTRYLLTDVWSDLASFQSFKKNFRKAYDDLDKQCEQLTVKEHCIGCFEEIEQKKLQAFPREDENLDDDIEGRKG